MIIYMTVHSFFSLCNIATYIFLREMNKLVNTILKLVEELYTNSMRDKAEIYRPTFEIKFNLFLTQKCS